jgi:hypothetical protein
MGSKAQDSVEYLIILAVVIIIALIIVGVMGGIPGCNSKTPTAMSKEDKLRLLCSVNGYQYVSHDSSISYSYSKLTCQSVEYKEHYNITQTIIINYDEGWLTNATNQTIQDTSN